MDEIIELRCIGDPTWKSCRLYIVPEILMVIAIIQVAVLIERIFVELRRKVPSFYNACATDEFQRVHVGGGFELTVRQTKYRGTLYRDFSLKRFLLLFLFVLLPSLFLNYHFYLSGKVYFLRQRFYDSEFLFAYAAYMNVLMPIAWVVYLANRTRFRREVSEYKESSYLYMIPRMGGLLPDRVRNGVRIKHIGYINHQPMQANDLPLQQLPANGQPDANLAYRAPRLSLFKVSFEDGPLNYHTEVDGMPMLKPEVSKHLPINTLLDAWFDVDYLLVNQELVNELFAPSITGPQAVEESLSKAKKFLTVTRQHTLSREYYEQTGRDVYNDTMLLYRLSVDHFKTGHTNLN